MQIHDRDANLREEEGGKTALMFAIEQGHVEVVTALIGGGADPSVETKQGHNALQHAVRLGKLECVKALGGTERSMNTLHESAHLETKLKDQEVDPEAADAEDGDRQRFLGSGYASMSKMVPDDGLGGLTASSS